MLNDLLTALKDEFSGDVRFHPSIPKQLVPPAVAVLPGDPFLTVVSFDGTNPIYEERWEIAVYASIAVPDMAITQLRDLSLRVRRVVSSIGARWIQANAINQLPDNSTLVSLNQVVFKYTL